MKMWKFSKTTGTDERHSFLVWTTARLQPSVESVRVWGIVSFIVVRYSTTFMQIDGIGSTLSCLYQAVPEPGGTQTTICL